MDYDIDDIVWVEEGNGVVTAGKMRKGLAASSDLGGCLVTHSTRLPVPDIN